MIDMITPIFQQLTFLSRVATFIIPASTE